MAPNTRWLLRGDGARRVLRVLRVDVCDCRSRRPRKDHALKFWWHDRRPPLQQGLQCSIVVLVLVAHALRPGKNVLSGDDPLQKVRAFAGELPCLHHGIMPLALRREDLIMIVPVLWTQRQGLFGWGLRWGFGRVGQTQLEGEFGLP